MAQRRLKPARGLGIWIPLDVAQRSSRHNFATVKPRTRSKINNVIGASNCFFIVLDNDQ